MKKIIKIGGMSCGHCSARVEKALLALPGVESVKVNLGTGEAEISFKSAIDDDALKNTVEDTGFEYIG